MESNEREVVVGVFEDQSRAQQAVDQLKSAGFKDDQIGFAVRTTENAGEAYDTTVAGDKPGGAGTGAIAGVVSGGVLGGILGAAASLLIPGIGPVIAGGILAATLGGAAIGAAAGGILGALTGMGVPEEEARYYQGEFEAGRTVVTVKAGNRQEEALNILRSNGAYDAETRSVGASVYGNNDKTQINTERTTQMEAGNMGKNQQNQNETEDRRAVQLREEQLRATKQQVEAGEVRLTKDVITEEKTITVPVQREQVHVEQRNVAPRPAEGAIGDQGETIKVPIMEEQVRIVKQPVVTGEVTIRKEQVQDNQQFSDTVRREEARVEREGDVDIQSSGVMQQPPSDQPNR